MSVLCAGQGQRYTQRYSGGTYHKMSFDDIWSMAQYPQPPVDKDQGWWVMFHGDNSSLGRSQEHIVEQNTRFHGIWADIDEGNPTIEQVIEAVRFAIGEGRRFLIYSTRSSEDIDKETGKVKGRKFRVIIPLKYEVVANAFSALALALNSRLDSCGMQCDEVNRGVQQLCFLPNPGPNYQYHPEPGVDLDLQGHPLEAEAEAQYAKLEAEEAEARARRDKGYGSPDQSMGSHYGAFRRKHPPVAILEECGFIYTGRDSEGDFYRHPLQNGVGGRGLQLRPNGSIYLLSSTMASWTTAKRSSKGGWSLNDATDFAIHFLFGGDQQAWEVYAKQCLIDQDSDLVEHGRSIWGACEAEINRAAQAVLDALLVDEETTEPEVMSGPPIPKKGEALLTDEIFDGQLDIPLFPKEVAPGLVGRLMSFYYHASPFQYWEMSTMSALAFMSGVIGREFRLDGLGLNNYYVSVAGTGLGKQNVINGPNWIADNLRGRNKTQFDIFTESGRFIYTGTRKASGQAYHIALAEEPCGTLAVDEYHEILKKQLSDRANPNSDFSVVLELYGASGAGGRLEEKSYASGSKDKRGSSIPGVNRPAFSINAVAIYDIYDHLTTETLGSGLPARHLFCEVPDYMPPENRNKVSTMDETTMVMLESLMDTVQRIRVSNQGMDTDTACEIEYANEEVAAERVRFMDYCRRQRNAASSVNLQSLWSRVGVHVFKTAAILAVGEHTNWYKGGVPKVTMAHMDWAKKLVGYCYGTLMRRTEAGYLSGPSGRRLAVCRDFLKKYASAPQSFRNNNGCPKALANHPTLITLSAIHEKMGNDRAFPSSADRDSKLLIDNVIGLLVESGGLRVLDDVQRGLLKPPGRGGRPLKSVFEIMPAET